VLPLFFLLINEKNHRLYLHPIFGGNLANQLSYWPLISLCLIRGDRIRFWKLNLASKWKGWLLVLEGGWLSEHVWHEICNGFWELKPDFLYHDCS
jgi:hypothetical protein